MVEERHLGGEWDLGRRVATTGGEVAWDVFGEGSPVVLVHGTPSNSYLWREIAPALARCHTVYVYDLPGFGQSERMEGQEVSIAAQARVLAELLGAWGLEEPAVAGHDIGGGIVLRAHLMEGAAFGRLALLDPVALTPWGTPTLKHVKAHVEAYRTMPLGPFEAIVASHLRTATSLPIEEASFETYLSQWRGEEGKAAYLRKDVQLDERDTAELEPLLGSIEVPVRILWGEEDGWLDPSQAEVLAARIPNSEGTIVAGAGHFVMEDAPDEVAEILADFFPDVGPERGARTSTDEERGRIRRSFHPCKEEMKMNSETNISEKHEVLASGSHGKSLIGRIWFGRTHRKHADEYLRYNYENGVREIEKKPGNLGVQQFRRIKGDVAEFTVISYWSSMEAMEAMHGGHDGDHGDVRRVAHLEKDPDYLLELPDLVEVTELHVNDSQLSLAPRR